MPVVGIGHHTVSVESAGRNWFLRATLSTPLAGPWVQRFDAVAQMAGGSIGRAARISTRQLGRRALFLLVNLLVAAVVMSLPFIASSASPLTGAQPLASVPVGSASLAPVDGEPQVSRAALQARGSTIVAGRDPFTVQSESVRPIPQYTLSMNDTLWTIANYYGISAEAIAFANGISDPYHLQVGRQIMIPPLEGALYTVTQSDTVESVATQFNVDPSVIRDYNRLYFEPEHFGPGQLIFIENATLPTLPTPTTGADANASVIARPAGSAPAARSGGYLAWPVNGVITQYMWAGHTGVDIAAPFGTGLAASVSGVISQNGWVAVGGLHICIQSGSLEECYYHLSAAYFPVGTPVTAGQIVAAIGLTGVTTGPHVHWETKVNGQLVNPLTVQP
jgi:murein DD-endopeptidase MepM/ murein hydrolase activator NlpD